VTSNVEAKTEALLLRSAPMIQTLVLSHGRLAQELLATAREIVGNELLGVHHLALDWSTSQSELRSRIAESVAALDQGRGVLILTDLFGDTPSNLAFDLSDPGRVEVVTGVNLPMVLRLTCLGNRDLELATLAQLIQERGQQGIRLGKGTNGDGGGS